jgi:hypothetical protein
MVADIVEGAVISYSFWGLARLGSTLWAANVETDPGYPKSSNTPGVRFIAPARKEPWEDSVPSPRSASNASLLVVRQTVLVGRRR